MKFIVYVLVILVSLGVGFYTFNFGRWLVGKKNYRGAAGVFVLAGLSAFLPLYLLFFGGD